MHGGVDMALNWMGLDFMDGARGQWLLNLWWRRISTISCDWRCGVWGVVCLQYWLGGTLHWIEGGPGGVVYWISNLD